MNALGYFPLFFLGLILVEPLCAAEIGMEALTVHEQLQVGRDSRNYVVSYPKDLDRARLVPLILAFHGYRGEVKSWFFEESAFVPLMAKEPFVIVYPEGPISWAPRENSRDVRFFDAMVTELEKKYPIDPSRIYVVGHSNGAVFASYLLLNRPGIVAAAVSHSGLYSADDFNGIPGKAPLMTIWGEKDPMNIAAPEAVQLLIQSYRNKGVSVETIFIPDWGHPWAAPRFEIEEKVLAFLFAHHLSLPDPKPKSE